MLSLFPSVLTRGQRSPEPIEPLETRIAPALVVAIHGGTPNTTPGSTLTYTIDYSNPDAQDATGVVLTDVLPAGTTFTAAENPGWSEVAGVLSFAAGDLAAGADGHATLIVHVAGIAAAGRNDIVNTVNIARAEAPSEASANETTALDAAPDLTVGKTSDAEGSVTPGTTIHYSIAFGNVGNQDATGVKLTEHLPAGTSFDALNSSEDWTAVEGSPGLYELIVGSVTGGTNGTRTFAVKVNNTAGAGAGQVSNTIDIADDGTNGADPTPADNTALNTLTLNAAPDLTLTKTSTAPSVAAGGSVTFHFDYTNAGNQDATGVKLTDTLPANTTFDANANPGWTLDGTTLTFTVGSVGAGFGGTATLTLGVAANVPAGAEQIASAGSIADDAANGADPTPANNTSTTNVLLDAAPDLTLTLTDGHATAAAGNTLTYTFNFTNAGHQGANGVVITETLPEGTTFNAAANPDWVLDGTTLTFTVGSLAAGGNGTATLVLKVVDTVPEGFTSITNTAHIADDAAGGADPTPANNTATDIDTIVSGTVDLNLHKTSTSSSLTPGGNVTYTFTFGNTGTTGASGSVITDTLPAGTTFNAASNPGWVLDGNTLTYAIGNLAAAGTGTATLTLGVSSTVPAGRETIVNSASIADDGTHGADFTPTDNATSLSLPLNAAPDLKLTETGGGTTVAPGATLTYTFTYSNVGTQQASGVVITEALPAGTTFDAASNPGWVLNGSTLTYAVGTLSSGSATPITLTLKVADNPPATQTTITSTGVITDDGTSGADATPTDNTATVTNTLSIPKADLSVTINSVGTIAPNGSLIFTLNYSNTGNKTANAVVLTEHLPSGTTFDAANSTAGWVAGASGLYTLTLDPLAAAASGSVTFAVTVTTPVAASLEQILNQVDIASDATDPTPANNSAQKSVTLTAAPNLGVTVTSTTTKVVPGGNVIFTINYTNTGDQNASGVKITEILPSGLSFVPTGSTDGWILSASHIYQFTVPSLAAGQSGTVTFVAKASSGLSASKITDQVSIADDNTSGTDSNTANNSNSLTIPVKGNASPSVPSFSGGGKGVWAMADDGEVKIFSKSNGALLYGFHPYGDDVEHVKVVMADFNGDGIADIVTSSKESSKIRIYDGRTGMLLQYFKPFGDSENGIRVAVWDVNGDGVADILAKQRDEDGKVRVFDGATIMTTMKPGSFMTLDT
jgi:uncharacterized repeat protein (TIGR01451 family)